MPRAARPTLLLPLVAFIPPDGRIHGMVDLPVQFRPLHVNADMVLGVFRDELDVEYIRGYTVS